MNMQLLTTQQQIDEEQRRLNLLLLQRQELEKYRYFTPIGKGQQFIDAVGSGLYVSLLFSAANGVGKTTIAANLLANLFWPVGNPAFQQPILDNWPKGWPKRGRIVSEPNTVKETIIPALREWFPANRYGVTKYETNKQGKTYEAEWETDTGWTFQIMTYDQDPKQFESANLGFVWEDEPPPYAIHIANISRLRDGGVNFVTETPLAGSAHLYDGYAANPKREQMRRFYIEADIEDACQKHGTNGFRPHSQIVDMISQYTEDERQARIFGKFQHLTGLVFKEWNRDVHVIKPFDINEQEFVVIEQVDPHPRTDDAVLWLAIDRKNRKYIIDELFGKYNSDELAYAIKKKTENWRIVRREMDQSAFIIDKHTGRSLASDMHQRGLRYSEASKQRQLAIRRSKEALSYRLQNGVMIKPPEVYVFSSCQRFIWEIEHWQWDEWRGKAAERKDPKEKPVDKDDHMMEAFGRSLLNNIKFVERPQQSYTYIANSQQSTNDDPYA